MGLKFSIVTVVLNRKGWIRDAIESALAQQYEDFEHVIVDGGSTDGTLDIVKSYPHLRWISEPDHGSVFALNKGLAMISGDVFGWLNSDETYLPGTFQAVDRYFSEHPDWGMLYGNTQFVNEDRQTVGRSRLRSFSLRRQILGLTHIPAPSAMFLRRTCLAGVGNRVDEQWRDAYDHDLWIRIGQKYRIQAVPHCFSTFALHSDSGVSATPERALRELALIRKHYGGEDTFLDRWVYVTYCNLFIWAYRRFRWPQAGKKEQSRHQRVIL